MLDEERGLTTTESERREEILDRINPRPEIIRMGYWWRETTEDRIFRPPLVRAFLPSARRARRGYSHRDTWSLNSCLSEAMSGAVERFAELNVGRPRRE
jgi:hypothetical protein